MATTFQLRVWTRYFASADAVQAARSSDGLLKDAAPALLPFSSFEHRHELEETPDGSRYVDHVVFRPSGPAQKMVAIATQRAFQQRHRAAAARLPADQRTIAVAVLRVVERDHEAGEED